MAMIHCGLRVHSRLLLLSLRRHTVLYRPAQSLPWLRIERGGGMSPLNFARSLECFSCNSGHSWVDNPGRAKLDSRRMNIASVHRGRKHRGGELIDGLNSFYAALLHRLFQFLLVIAKQGMDFTMRVVADSVNLRTERLARRVRILIEQRLNPVVVLLEQRPDLLLLIRS
jgi:hypothetical protein